MATYNYRMQTITEGLGGASWTNLAGLAAETGTADVALTSPFFSDSNELQCNNILALSGAIPSNEIITDVKVRIRGYKGQPLKISEVVLAGVVLVLNGANNILSEANLTDELATYTFGSGRYGYTSDQLKTFLADTTNTKVLFRTALGPGVNDSAFVDQVRLQVTTTLARPTNPWWLNRLAEINHAQY